MEYFAVVWIEIVAPNTKKKNTESIFGTFKVIKSYG